jgi:hypothetical protein
VAVVDMDTVAVPDLGALKEALMALDAEVHADKLGVTVSIAVIDCERVTLDVAEPEGDTALVVEAVGDKVEVTDIEMTAVTVTFGEKDCVSVTVGELVADRVDVWHRDTGADAVADARDDADDVTVRPENVCVTDIVSDIRGEVVGLVVKVGELVDVDEPLTVDVEDDVVLKLTVLVASGDVVAVDVTEPVSVSVTTADNEVTADPDEIGDNDIVNDPVGDTDGVFVLTAVSVAEDDSDIDPVVEGEPVPVCDAHIVGVVLGLNESVRSPVDEEVVEGHIDDVTEPLVVGDTVKVPVIVAVADTVCVDVGDTLKLRVLLTVAEMQPLKDGVFVDVCEPVVVTDVVEVVDCDLEAAAENENVDVPL